MSDFKITWAEWEKIRKSPDIRERFELVPNACIELLKGLLGKLDGKDLYITDLWDSETPEAPVKAVGAALGRVGQLVEDSYHEGVDGVMKADDMVLLQNYFGAVQELLSNARDWAGGFNSEDGFIGPHRYAMALAESVQKMDKLEGCTCPEDDSGDMTPGCPVHDEGGTQ